MLFRTPTNALTPALAQVFGKGVIHGIELQHSVDMCSVESKGDAPINAEVQSCGFSSVAWRPRSLLDDPWKVIARKDVGAALLPNMFHATLAGEERDVQHVFAAMTYDLQIRPILVQQRGVPDLFVTCFSLIPTNLSQRTPVGYISRSTLCTVFSV